MLPGIIIAVVVIFFMGIRIIRPTSRGLVERLGKYNRFLLHYSIPEVNTPSPPVTTFLCPRAK